jgi:hypothetical protein
MTPANLFLTLCAAACIAMLACKPMQRLMRRKTSQAGKKLGLVDGQLRAPTDGAVKLGETLRLAVTIAEYASRADIECGCKTATRDGATWWNTNDFYGDETVEREFVRNAVAFLHLRGRIEAHPQEPSLVRFLR